MLLNHFWTRLRKEYLLQLRSAHASKPVRIKTVKVGDVVLLDDPAASRSYWPVAVVQSLSGGESSDSRKRAYTITLVSGKKEPQGSRTQTTDTTALPTGSLQFLNKACVQRTKPVETREA